MKGPLSDLKVVDLTSVLMGPYCTQILADMGADVIKVENKKGDSTRYIGPSKNKGMGSTFLHLSRNKRSIVLDLKTKEGKTALLEIVKGADIFVHSMRHQAIEKLGLTYDELKQVNEKIIYCEAYGFSKKGPYGNKPAYDDIIQAASGLVAAQGASSGRPEYMSTILADKTTGIMMVNAVLAALYYRERTGKGQDIEVPMFETMTFNTMLEHLYGFTFNPPMGDSLYPRLTSKYRKPYRTKDGFISVIVYNDKHWKTFFEMAGFPGLINDARFRDISARTENIDELYQMIEDIMLTKSTKEWLTILSESDIPAMPVNKPEDLLHDPHLKHINFFEKVKHPSEGEIWDMSYPANFSETPVKTRSFAPLLGEQSREILEEIGYSEDQIDSLFEDEISIEHKNNEVATKSNN